MSYWISNPVRGVWHAGLLAYEQKNIRVTSLTLLRFRGVVREISGPDFGSCCKSTDGSFSCTLHPGLSPEELERTCLYQLAHILLGHLNLPLRYRFGFRRWLIDREADAFVSFYPYLLKLFRGKEDIQTVLNFILATLAGLTVCEDCGYIEISSLMHLCREII